MKLALNDHDVPSISGSAKSSETSPRCVPYGPALKASAVRPCAVQNGTDESGALVSTAVSSPVCASGVTRIIASLPQAKAPMESAPKQPTKPSHTRLMSTSLQTSIEPRAQRNCYGSSLD